MQEVINQVKQQVRNYQVTVLYEVDADIRVLVDRAVSRNNILLSTIKWVVVDNMEYFDND